MKSLKTLLRALVLTNCLVFLAVLANLSTTSAEAEASAIPKKVLKVLSLNVWLWPPVSKDDDLRIIQIAKFVNKNKFDVVALQEVWFAKGRQSLIEKLKAQLPYSYFETESVLMGAGLLLLSRYPISQSSFQKFEHNTTIIDATLQSKGMLHAKIKIDESVEIDCFNTHLPPIDFDLEKDQFIPKMQTTNFKAAQEFQEYLLKRSQKSDYVIALGDFNFPPHIWQSDENSFVGTFIENATLPYGLLSKYLFDVLEGSNEPTFDYRFNSYAEYSSGRNEPPLRIDYIWIKKNGKLIPRQGKSQIWKQPLGNNSQNTSNKKKNRKKSEASKNDSDSISQLSDHFGISTELEIQ